MTPGSPQDDAASDLSGLGALGVAIARHAAGQPASARCPRCRQPLAVMRGGPDSLMVACRMGCTQLHAAR